MNVTSLIDIFDLLVKETNSFLAATNIINILLAAAKTGALPGLLAGAVALPLMSSTGVIFKFSIGAVIGAIGAAVFRGFTLAGTLGQMSDFFSMHPAAAGDFFGSLLYAGVIGLMVGGILVLIIYETMHTLWGMLAGTILGIIAGLILELLKANLGWSVDPRITSVIIGAVVFAFTAILLGSSAE